jgi:hypothetical protein
MARQVIPYFKLEGTVQHPLRSGQAELVEGTSRFFLFPFGVDLDYILHRWRVLPLWPQGPRLNGLQTEDYAAYLKSSIHNNRSYLREAGANRAGRSMISMIWLTSSATEWHGGAINSHSAPAWLRVVCDALSS